MSPYATKAIVGDVTDLEFLKSLGVEEFDVGIVAIGNHLEDSILAVLNLKELNLSYVIAKAKNKRFKEVLEKVGANYVIRPEKEMGEKIAKSLLRNKITDLIELDEKYSVVEMVVPDHWVGQTLMTLNLRKTYNINILGRRDKDTKKLDLFIDPNYILEKDDHFLMIAETAKIEKFDYTLH